MVRENPVHHLIDTEYPPAYSEFRIQLLMKERLQVRDVPFDVQERMGSVVAARGIQARSDESREFELAECYARIR